MPPIDANQWYTLTEAAAFLHREIRTLRHWRRQGRFSPGALLRDPSGHYRVLGAEVLRLLGTPVEPVATHIEGQWERERRNARNLKRLAELGC